MTVVFKWSDDQFKTPRQIETRNRRRRKRAQAAALAAALNPKPSTNEQPNNDV